tara:strand:+ start:3447 stop:4166 length:720 start_codon:yes stop_codon:yes gene_type:complete
MSTKTFNLRECKYKKYSEFFQDSILERIFNIIGTTNKFFVEFGSNGCMYGGGNTAYLREKFEMTGLLMDGSEHPYNEKTKLEFERKIEFITAENINMLFKKYNVPDKIDFLSIDIDGEDYWVMKNLNIDKYRPRVICIETNYHINPELKIVQCHNPDHIWRGNDQFGCSSSAILDLLNKKNYTMVAYIGPDCIFIDNYELNKNNIIFKGQNNLIELGVMEGPIRDNKRFENSFFTTLNN